MWCGRIILGMIATRTYLVVEGILASGRKIANRLIILLGGMAAMQKLTLNSNNWQSAIQNIQEIWREEEEKAAVLLESWLQCLSYWNSFIRIICLRLVFVGRHSSVDKAPTNPAARLAPWIGRTPNTKFQHLLWVVSWFPYLRKKAVFLMPAWDPRETSLLVSARGGGIPEYRISWERGPPLVYVTG